MFFIFYYRNIPYCSSDLWIGNKTCGTNCSDDFNFLGQSILNNVLDDLIKIYGMDKAESVLLVGVR